jgi:hypothetical protein
MFARWHCVTTGAPWRVCRPHFLTDALLRDILPCYLPQSYEHLFTGHYTRIKPSKLNLLIEEACGGENTSVRCQIQQCNGQRSRFTLIAVDQYTLTRTQPFINGRPARRAFTWSRR